MDWEAIQDLLVFPLVLLALAECQTGGLAGGLADWRTVGGLIGGLIGGLSGGLADWRTVSWRTGGLRNLVQT